MFQVWRGKIERTRKEISCKADATCIWERKKQLKSFRQAIRSEERRVGKECPV